ncbi:MAG TPA: hypothetical protein VFC37_23430 [Terracidiphilus sp.]|jgi:hypothetical protein|nr:hypothetical protein [Terracidiphilus sp.]
MNLQEIREAHIAALHELYKRIADIARSIGGVATEGTAPRRLTVNVAVPRDENVPALTVEMPDNFQVNFGPPNALGHGNALSVRAQRIHHGGTRNDWTLNLMQGVWQYAQKTLSDEDIRRCLTPEGPPALY